MATGGAVVVVVVGGGGMVVGTETDRSTTSAAGTDTGGDAVVAAVVGGDVVVAAPSVPAEVPKHRHHRISLLETLIASPQTHLLRLLIPGHESRIQVHSHYHKLRFFIEINYSYHLLRSHASTPIILVHPIV